MATKGSAAIGGARVSADQREMAKILIAEDEEAAREFIARALSQQGHEVSTVSDGAEALTALAEGHYELLLTDIAMPVIDGIALALKVAKDYPALRILMMTGYASEKQRAHNLDALIHGLIVKPFTMQQIRDAAEAALE